MANIRDNGCALYGHRHMWSRVGSGVHGNSRLTAITGASRKRRPPENKEKHSSVTVSLSRCGLMLFL